MRPEADLKEQLLQKSKFLSAFFFKTIDIFLILCYIFDNLTGVYLAKDTGTTLSGVKAIRTAGSTADWRVYRLID